jgi:hypothetical protein
MDITGHSRILRFSDASILAAIPGVPGIRIQRERSHAYTGRSRNIIYTASVLADLPGVPGSARLRRECSRGYTGCSQNPYPAWAFLRIYRAFPKHPTHCECSCGPARRSRLFLDTGERISHPVRVFSESAIREANRATNTRYPPLVRRPPFVPRRSSTSTAITAKIKLNLIGRNVCIILICL